VYQEPYEQKYQVYIRLFKVCQNLLPVKRRQMMTLKYREVDSCLVSQSTPESALRSEAQLIP
jgi:hypothetical protein